LTILVDQKNAVCNTTHMTNDKFTTEQLLTMASNLGVETNGIELTESQKTELATKLAVVMVMMESK